MNSLQKQIVRKLNTFKNMKNCYQTVQNSNKIMMQNIVRMNQMNKFYFSADKNSQETMDQLKKQAEQFYEEQVQEKQPSNIYYIENSQQWKSIVMDSKEPVILDCYADWCEPCKKLDPILIEKAKQLGDKCKLVKLDIDKNPEIATALQVKSIPTVYLVHGANAVDGFVGFPQEPQLQKFFDSVNRICGLQDEESDITSDIALAQTFLEENKRLGDAKKILMTILENEKWKNRFGGKIYSLLAYMNVLEGDRTSYQKHLSELKTKFSEESETEEIKEILKKCEQKLEEIQENTNSHPFIQECLQILKEDEKNHEVRYQLAEYQFNKALNEEAIENCLFIVKKNRNWEDKKAQKLLISAFESLGSSHELTIKGRQKLQRLLF